MDNEFTTGSGMALDADGKAHTGFVGWGDIKYATNKSGMWVTELIEDIVNQSCFPSVVVDRNNHIHASY